jgi:hypothetical protein
MRIRAAAAIFAFAVSAASAAAADRSFSLCVFGGIQHFPAYGTAADYVPGENDFPVTPAHTAAMTGLAFGRAAGLFLFELDARWTFPRSVVLKDPSDGDSAPIKTTAHVTAVLNALYSPFRGAWRPYVEAGGGVDVVLARSEVVTTAYGYVIDRPALRTADRFDPEAHMGGGLILALGAALAFRVDIRAVWVFDDPRPVRSLQAMGGLSFYF